MVLGLVGGIAAGKSTVASMLAGFGAMVIDCDEVARELVCPGEPGWSAVAAEFGPDILLEDGSIDRKLLGAVVFADKGKLEKLNSLLHPPLASQVEKMLKGAGDRLAVVDAAVLVESGMYRLCDHVCLVTAKVETRIKRLVDVRGILPEDARKRVYAQSTDASLRPYCDRVIDTDADIACVTAQVKAIMEAIGASGRPS